MFSWVVLVVAALAMLQGVAVATGAEGKFGALKMLASRSSSNVVELDDSTYAGFVTDERSRPYKLMVLLTASHPKFKCAVCKDVEASFNNVASSYASHLVSEGGGEPSIFFVKIDYASSSKTFKNYDVNSVPIIFYLGQQHGLEGSPYDIPTRNRFAAGNLAEGEAEGMASFLHQRSGVSFKVYKPMWMSYIYLLCFFAAALWIVRRVIQNLEWYIGLIQIKSIWMTISLGLYVCAISGLIFDIIRSPPMYQHDSRSGKTMYFYPHQGNQFVVEGFIIGFLNLMCGGSLFFLGVVAPTCSKDAKKRTTLMVISATAFIVCFYAVRSFYKLKNGWYNF
jgi:hypothetical protein